MKNVELSQIFDQIAKILKIKGENPFKIRAYENIVSVLNSLPTDIESIYRKGELNDIPGVGKAIAKKIEEYLTTNKLEYYEKLKETIPSGVIGFLDILEIGPKTARLLYEQLGVDSIEKLEKAIEEHRIKDLPGMGEKSEENILRGIKLYRKRHKRFLLGIALPIAKKIKNHLGKMKEVKKINIAGSLRRRVETIGDIDILAASTKPEKIMKEFISLPQTREVLSEGLTKSTIITNENIQVDLRIVNPLSYGAALQYFTGSQNHNIKIRGLAQKKGLKINEYGVYDAVTDKKIAGEQEVKIYKTLNLPYIPSELREDRGEIESALENKLPKIVEYSDIRGDLHIHSKWSDGNNTILQMAEAAEKSGFQYIAITDHSQSLGVAGGLAIERINEQIKKIKLLNQELSDFTILCGSEVDIKIDGSLDFPDEILSGLDIVIAAIHSGFKQDSKTMTRRIVNAMKNKWVHMIAHPTGRIIDYRDPYQIDMREIIKAAAETGTILEINARPERLDLNDVYCRMAKDKGVQLAIGTDAHSTDGFRTMEFGVSVARRGWLEKKDVINTLPLHKLLKRLRKKKEFNKL